MPKRLTYQQIEDKILGIVVEQLCLQFVPVRTNANFSTELGADSLDIVELVMALEEEFSIQIPDEAAGRISNIEQAAKFVEHILYE